MNAKQNNIETFNREPASAGHSLPEAGGVTWRVLVSKTGVPMNLTIRARNGIQALYRLDQTCRYAKKKYGITTLKSVPSDHTDEEAPAKSDKEERSVKLADLPEAGALCWLVIKDHDGCFTNLTERADTGEEVIDNIVKSLKYAESQGYKPVADKSIGGPHNPQPPIRQDRPKAQPPKAEAPKAEKPKVEKPKQAPKPKPAPRPVKHAKKNRN